MQSLLEISMRGGTKFGSPYIKYRYGHSNHPLMGMNFVLK